MTFFFLALFVLTFFLCLASYALYPAGLWLAGKLAPFREKREETAWPRVSILIAAYNEEKHLAEKIRNTLAIDYSRDLLEILVGSDGSTDASTQVAEGFRDQGVGNIAFQENRGKTAVQNDLVSHATGDIIVFTDAASFIPADAVKKMVAHFADPQVGCVAGRMHFMETDKNLNTQSQGLYWRYEVFLRELESRLGSLIGVDGPLYTVRRQCLRPLAPHIISDLMVPLLVLEQGYRVVLEKEALVEEAPTQKSGQEFTTRRRITLRGLTGLVAYRHLLNPCRHFALALQISLHKLVRWFVGPLVLLHLLACAALSPYWHFGKILLLYGCFFLLAAGGWLLARQGKRARLLTVPYYFCLVNLAATAGIIDFCRRKQAVTWKPVRQ